MEAVAGRVFEGHAVHPLTRLFRVFQRRDFLLMLHRANMSARDATAWYPEWVYEMMETDEARNRRYRAAIDRRVGGKVVLELGTGRKALWALHCARRGAERVYAVEANRQSFESSRRCVIDSGLTRVTVLPGFSDNVLLPEPCDVLVHDLVGAIGSSEGMIPFVRDAKARLLKPNAVHLPLRCRTYFFPTARPPHTFAEAAFNLLARGGRLLRSLPTVMMYGHRADAMLSDPLVFEDFDFSHELPVAEKRRSEFTVTRDGLWEAFTFFIRLAVDEEHVIDALAERTNWHLPYVRPFARPIAVRKGDTVRVDSTACYQDANPSYRLVCSLHGRGSVVPVADYSWSGV